MDVAAHLFRQGSYSVRFALSIAVCATALFAAVANDHSQAGDQASPRRTTASIRPSDSTLMLTVQIDATGVSILQARRKPKLRFRLPRLHEHMPFRWTLRDRDGSALQIGGFDPGPMELAPSRRGSIGHLAGDFLIPTETCMNVKVPALAFDHAEFEVRRDDEFVPFGKVRFGEFEVR